MRITASKGKFRAKVIAGTRAVLIALDCDEASRHGLMGFAFRREAVGEKDNKPKWLRSQKVFKSLVPNAAEALNPEDPTKQVRFSTWEHPIQSFLWGDYTATPDTLYKFTVVPMYGKPGALKPSPGLNFEIRTEKEIDQGHGVWFNRGAIASQVFAREFGNKGPQPPDNPDPNDPTTKWLSRGLLEACLKYINDTPKGDGLRVAAYEFTYKPVLDALKAALGRGVDVRIVYHDTSTEDGATPGPNEAAIAASELPKRFNRKQVLYPRTKTKIPHNKFIVRLTGGTEPTHVWTGSTNFTPSGFLGQSNVGHLIKDEETARQYLAYWEVVKKDPDLETARAAVTKLTPNPPALIPEKSVARIFSPRPKADLLNWYGDRISNAVGSLMFTAAFGVAKQLVPPLIDDCDYLRFILMEKPLTEANQALFKKNRNCITSHGAVLGEMYTFKNGQPVARRRIKEFDLDKWFLKEEHFRKSNEGFVFFIHTKFLLIDPLSDDPLVCSGSANFSSNSLLQNDENMLLVRGDTRVADIYLTEFDRIFRHFYFRDVANEIEARGGAAKGAFLDETSAWTDSYFRPKAFKTLRRGMFFADSSKSWAANAGKPKEKKADGAKKSDGAKKATTAVKKAGAENAAKKASKSAAKKPATK
ncbi:MAG TPA: phospholipase D-like domain-containing protein [Blastocatellia bacterium]|nr:phospholipase D-like domain-containing protein [Blastocatellia bacterium]